MLFVFCKIEEEDEVVVIVVVVFFFLLGVLDEWTGSKGGVLVRMFEFGLIRFVMMGLDMSEE